MDQATRPARTVLHLVASPFVGGPERQMIGLANAMRGGTRSVFLGFPEGAALDARLREEGVESHLLSCAGRPLLRSVREVEGWLRHLAPDVLVTHGYKPDLVGLLAARRAGIPQIAVSHGWTGATRRVRINEAIDKLVMRGARRVVAVSRRQGERVVEAGIRGERVVVIHNAVDVSRFRPSDPAVRREMESLFPERPGAIVIAAGRLSPEKGFDVLVAAARRVIDRLPNVGFLLVGDGPLRRDLEAQIHSCGLRGRFVLAGFRDDVDRLMPSADLFVQSSHTEGLPNVVLEAGASGVPIVATAVGGTGEVVQDGAEARLVPPARADLLADAVTGLLSDPATANRMATAARRRITADFTFASKAAAYGRLLEECLP
jgi:glycosyltransferase involved in cell wall biosynthesis